MCTQLINACSELLVIAFVYEMDFYILHMKSLRELFTVERIARVSNEKSYLNKYNETGNCISSSLPTPTTPIYLV